MEEKFLPISEQGLILLPNGTLTNPELGRSILSKIQTAKNGSWISFNEEEEITLEPFDAPLVVLKVLPQSASTFQGICNYGFSVDINLDRLSLDEWDRFNGYSNNNIPFVLSPPAQDQFFNLLDSFDDESITYKGSTFSVGNYWETQPEVEKEFFWTSKYQNQQDGWDLGQASPGFTTYLPLLKLPPSRVIVLGGGRGHDAALFAEAGHFVTLIDISPIAIQEAKAKYGHLTNLKFLQEDIFGLSEGYNQSFDIVIEHTCYCAVNPALRGNLVKTWNRLLAPGGHLFGIFFAMEKKGSPPFGGTEWELRERLKKYFRPLYWQRLRNSLGGRNGKEFLVYAQKKG